MEIEKDKIVMSQKRLICAMSALHHAQGEMEEQKNRKGFIEAMLYEVDEQNSHDDYSLGVRMAQNYMSITSNNEIKVKLGSWLVATSRDCLEWTVTCDALWLFRSNECFKSLRNEFLEKYPDAFNKEQWEEYYISEINTIIDFVNLLGIEEINKNKYSQSCYDNLSDTFEIISDALDEHIGYFREERILMKIGGAEKVVNIVFNKNTEIDIEDGIYKLFTDRNVINYRGFIEVRNKEIVSAQDISGEDIGKVLTGIKLREDADVPVDYGFFNKGRDNFLGGGSNWISE